MEIIAIYFIPPFLSLITSLAIAILYLDKASQKTNNILWKIANRLMLLIFWPARLAMHFFRKSCRTKKYLILILIIILTFLLWPIAFLFSAALILKNPKI